jgi:hypothetical protein
MSATASHPDKPMSEHESRVVSIGQNGSAKSKPSAAPSTLSLSMMHQAFDGLLVYTETSWSSNAEQRDELERSDDAVDRLDRAPNAFVEEKYSYEAVSESDALSVSDASTRRTDAASEGSRRSTHATSVGDDDALRSLTSPETRGLSG